MTDDVVPNVTYSYHTYNSNSAIGGPLFILLYIQCAMFAMVGWFHLTVELWQLVFPTAVVVVTLVAGMLNSTYNS